MTTPFTRTSLAEDQTGSCGCIDFVSIHTYPFLNYQQWDWRQEGVPAGPLRAEAMMNASLTKAQDNYRAVYDYRYLDASGRSVTVGESLPIVIGETGWKWRQTTPTQLIENYAALPVNAKWYSDLMRTWEGSPGGPSTIFVFEAFDEAWKGTDDGWGFWDELRMPNYALCGTPAGSACNDPAVSGRGLLCRPVIHRGRRMEGLDIFQPHRYFVRLVDEVYGEPTPDFR